MLRQGCFHGVYLVHIFFKGLIGGVYFFPDGVPFFGLFFQGLLLVAHFIAESFEL